MKTIDDLYKYYLSQGYIPLEEVTDSEVPKYNTRKLKFVLYARKSTDESSGKQVYSINDQITACMTYAKQHRLNVVKIIKESASARIADNRPQFKEMLSDIKKGKYDAILAWHPDRLARNMKEAGEILDLLEQGILKDLKFVEMEFHNTTSGKVMLGVHFVFAKMYSDQISDNTRRSYLHRVKEGKLGVFSHLKHGYYRDITGYLRPDVFIDENGNRRGSFDLLKEAFRMRYEGKEYKEIVKWLNEQPYTLPDEKALKNGDNTKRKIFKMNINILTRILKNPLYAGVYLWKRRTGEKIAINLIEVDPTFEPITTPEVFVAIQKFKRSVTYSSDLPFSRKVKCYYCGQTMTTYKRKKTLKSGTLIKYLYLRCENKNCYRNNKKLWTIEDKNARVSKNIRGKVIWQFAIQHLKSLRLNHPEAEKLFTTFLKQWLPSQEKELQQELISLKRKRTKLKQKLEEIKNTLITLNENSAVEKDVKSIFLKDLEQLKKQIEEIENQVQDKILKLEKLKQKDIMKKYLELLKNLPKKLQNTKNANTIRAIINLVYLNLTVDMQKVVDYTLRFPFKEIEKLSKNHDWLPGQDSNLQPAG